jgi:hypothetical protein
MAGSDVQNIVERILEAHGDASRWRKLELSGDAVSFYAG